MRNHLLCNVISQQKMEQNTADTDLIEANFSGRKPEPEISFMKVGLILVLLFWATFGFAWLAISSSQKGFKPKLPELQSLDKLTTLTHGAKSVGRVLGLTSKWDTKTALAFLNTNISEISSPTNSSIVVATYVLTPKGSDKKDTYTLSSEYNIDKEKAYISATSLKGDSSQYIVNGERLYSRNSTTEKWAEDYALEMHEFSTADASGQAIFKDLEAIIANKTPSFKGVEKVNDNEILQFSLNINEDLYNRNLASEEQFFSEMQINFWLNTKTKSIEKIEVVTRNLFIGETQYTSKKTLEYVKSTLSEEDLKLIQPEASDIEDTKSKAKLTDKVLAIFQLL
jgi:hypothetical protein